MKKFNFLSKTKWLFVPLMLLTLSVGNVWGAIASGTYVLCTSTSDLEAGAHYIIANGTSGTVNCISNVSNNNNRKVVSATVSSNKITVAANSTIMTFTLGGNSTNGWTFSTDNYAGTAGYLASASSGNNNYCRVIATSTTGTISFSDNAAVINLSPHSSRTLLRYNHNNGNPMFACYSSGQQAVYLYKKAAASCSNKVALTKGTPSNGTFSLNKSNGSYDNCDENFVVTVSSISANTGYYCSGVTATGGNSTVTGPDGSGNYTVTYTKGNNITSTITANFAPKTARTVTFMNNGAQYGDVRNLYDGDAVGTLPSAPSSCKVGKVFVGWSETNIGVTPTDVAPSFISASTVVSGGNKTYYAVFATVTPGEEEVLSQTLAYDTWTYSGTTADKTSYRLFGNNSYVQSASFDLSTLSKVIVYGGTFGGASYNSLTIGDGTNTWKSVTVSGDSQTGTNTYTDGTALSGTGALRVTSKSGNGSSNGVRISQIKIYTIPNVYSGYITECCTELAQINGSVDLNHLPS